jgi:hypothetical protein
MKSRFFATITKMQISIFADCMASGNVEISELLHGKRYFSINPILAIDGIICDQIQLPAHTECIFEICKRILLRNKISSLVRR